MDLVCESTAERREETPHGVSHDTLFGGGTGASGDLGAQVKDPQGCRSGPAIRLLQSSIQLYEI